MSHVPTRFKHPHEALDHIWKLKSRQHHAEALAVAEAALVDWPYHATLIGQKAHVLHLLKRTDEGLLFLTEAARRIELPDFVQSIEAELLASAGRVDEARARIDQVLSSDRPGDAALKRCIEVLHRLGEKTRVDTVLERYVAQARDRREALLLSARLAADPSGALARLRREFPDDPYVLEVTAVRSLEGLAPEEKADELGALLDTSRGQGNDRLRARRAMELRKAGQPEAARDELLACLRRDPENEFLHNQLALCLRDLGDVDGALDHFERAVRLRPDAAITRRLLFATYKPAGALTRARAFVEEMAAAHPEAKGAWWNAWRKLSAGAK